tara:strand:+ start:314 stop:1291 length:978 start_codon:yes stop_codon:yes gene_type:complete
MKSNKLKKVFIAGHNGMVGSAIFRKLKKVNNCILITKDRNELDLTNQLQVKKFFEKERIDQVYLAAAKVGGIYANNKFPADFICQNLLIQTNVIESSFLSGVKKLLFLGSSCIYPKFSDQPIKEKELLNGKLEETNESYAIAKIAGIKLCEGFNRQYSKSHQIDYRSIMPTNLYGPGDNYHPTNSHVIPALIRRIHLAKLNNQKEIEIWGTGNAKREFLHVNDLAKASIHIMNMDQNLYRKVINDFCSHINVGTGIDIKIKDLVSLLIEIIGFRGKAIYDSSKPDGTPRKLLDISKIKDLGWQPQINLRDGLVSTYENFKNIEIL